VFALQSNDFIILFADDDRIYAKHGYQRADNPCRWLRINEHMLLWGVAEPVDDALMYKRIGANNWRQEFSIYWVICINVRVLPIDTSLKLDKF